MEPQLSIITHRQGVVIQVIGNLPHMHYKADKATVARLGMDAVKEMALALYREREKNKDQQ